MKVEKVHGREKDLLWPPASSIENPKNSWCDWIKAMVILVIISIILLLVAVIVIPIIVVQLTATQTASTTTTTATTVSLPNQCSNYTLDTDASRLSSYSVYTPSGCDVSLYSTSLWVRFGGTATRMATSPPSVYQCATSATGWYAGALPSTVGATVTGVACFAWTSSICDFHSTIQVTNCNGFYVFFLVAPSQCSLRYCTE